MARSLFDRSFLYEASLKNRAQCCCHFYFFFPFVPGPRNPLFGVGRFLGFHVRPRPAWDTFNHAVSTGDCRTGSSTGGKRILLSSMDTRGRCEYASSFFEPTPKRDRKDN